ncbi:MAG TPA: helix-turn-helix transcriptional regulator [Solirubrobacterales bacterium]|nr:helix-turn-helix transcriptional regulator [Solirubrobacterales bacterium]
MALSELVREMRRSAGLSQRALAEKAGTSQPAIVRYERGAATPSWETLERLARACDRRLDLDAVPVSDPQHLALTKTLLDLDPLERLRALRRYTRLRALAQDQLL